MARYDNPAQQGIDAAKAESADRHIFGDKYEGYIQFVAEFKQSLNSLISKYQSVAGEEFPEHFQTARISHEIKELVLFKGMWM